MVVTTCVRSLKNRAHMRVMANGNLLVHTLAHAFTERSAALQNYPQWPAHYKALVDTGGRLFACVSQDGIRWRNLRGTRNPQPYFFGIILAARESIGDITQSPMAGRICEAVATQLFSRAKCGWWLSVVECETVKCPPFPGDS